MHPRIEEVSRYLDEQRVGLRAAIDSVPVDRRGISPAPGRWSVDGVVEHLAVIEARVTGLLGAKVAEARAAGLKPETDDTPVLDHRQLARVLDRTTKIVAPEPVHPRGALDAEAAWEALESTRERLRGVLRDADGLACREIMHPHPVFGPLDFYTWIGFIGAHEARHADQIREIGASLGGV